MFQQGKLAIYGVKSEIGMISEIAVLRIPRDSTNRNRSSSAGGCTISKKYVANFRKKHSAENALIFQPRKFCIAGPITSLSSE